MHSKDGEESSAGSGLGRDRGGQSGMRYTEGVLQNRVCEGALGS